MYARRLDPSVLAFSLTLYRHPFIYIFVSSRFRSCHSRRAVFHTKHKVKTQQVARSRGQCFGNIKLAGYLANAAGPVPLVLDLRIAHERFGSSSHPNLNGHLHNPNDIDKSLHESTADKIRKYRDGYNNKPPNCRFFMPAIASTSRRLHNDFVHLLFLQAHRKLTVFSLRLQHYGLL